MLRPRRPHSSRSGRRLKMIGYAKPGYTWPVAAQARICETCASVQMVLPEREDTGISRQAGSPTVITPENTAPFLDLRELWAYREVLYALIHREIRIRYAQTIAGAGWVILQPLLTAAVLTLLAGRVVHIPAQGVAYTLFAVSGLIPWNYFNHALTKSSLCLVSTGLVSKAYFPRLLLLLAAVAGGLIDLLVASPVLVVLMIWYRTAPGWRLLLLPACVLPLLVATIGIGAWVSILNLYFRDVSHALPFFTQLAFFLTPAAYPISLIPDNLRSVYSLNPLVVAIELWRWSLFRAPFALSAREAITSATAGIALLVSGLWYFRREEPTIADIGE